MTCSSDHSSRASSALGLHSSRAGSGPSSRIQTQLGLSGVPRSPTEILAAHHYLGPRSGLTYQDDTGVLVFGNPTSRNLPHPRFIELKRWCIISKEKNGGTRQWKRVVSWLRGRTDATTVVSYSDPEAGHDGALYRACNWLWAPTWHRLNTPPTGLGLRGGKRNSPKDRWVFLLRHDPDREAVLALKKSVIRRYPWASYSEPRWRKNRHRQEGGGDYQRFRREMI